MDTSPSPKLASPARGDSIPGASRRHRDASNGLFEPGALNAAWRPAPDLRVNRHPVIARVISILRASPPCPRPMTR